MKLCDGIMESEKRQHDSKTKSVAKKGTPKNKKNPQKKLPK
jgi:hypothetical protein